MSAALPLDDAAFAALMAPLGPWDGRCLAVAVSGGADSLALALLAARWAGAERVRALVVDHGLRAGSAAEAVQTCGRLAGLGIGARVLRLEGLAHGPALAARARAARYGALLAACREAGLADLLLGHHAGDQAETVLMRRRAGSGIAGLSGMAPVVVTSAARLVRPLLSVPAVRLRATLRAAGLGWVEDPSNSDPSATRARVREELSRSGEGPALLELARTAAVARGGAGRATAAYLAHATIRPEGFAVLPPGPVPEPALAALLRVLGGAGHPPGAEQVARLAGMPRPATLGGVRVLPAGRLGPGWLLTREVRALRPPVPATPGAVWDGRYRLVGEAPAGAELGALGEEGRRLRSRPGLPMVVLRTLPALRLHGVLVIVPHLDYRAGQMCVDLQLLFNPGQSPAVPGSCGVARGNLMPGGPGRGGPEPVGPGLSGPALT